MKDGAEEDSAQFSPLCFTARDVVGERSVAALWASAVTAVRPGSIGTLRVRLFTTSEVVVLALWVGTASYDTKVSIS